MRIFGLSGDPRGQKQSGKDTLARLCSLETSLSVKSRAFADPLKEFCMNYLGLSRENCYGEDCDKDQIVGEWGDYFDSRLQIKYDAAPHQAISARTIMQVVGTDIFRECFRDTFWVDLMENREVPKAIEEGVDILFITDIRFRNEIDMVRRVGGEMIRIYRNIPRKDAIVHKSERELAEIPDEEFDYIIHNDGDLCCYRETAVKFLKERDLRV